MTIFIASFLSMRGGITAVIMGAATLTFIAPVDATPSAPPPTAPEIGAISRSTGHLFREGLAAGLTAERGSRTVPITNDQGLLTDTAQGALPENLWDGLAPDDLKQLLTAVRPNPGLPPTLRLAQRVLLSDTEWPDTPDLQALRLQKMTLFHLGSDAAHLYAHLGPIDPPVPLLRAGVEALMADNQYASACLELRANLPRLAPKNKDLTALAAACQAHDRGQGLTAPYASATTLAAFAVSPDLTVTVLNPPSEAKPSALTELTEFYAAQQQDKPPPNITATRHLIDLLADQPFKLKTLFAPALAHLPATTPLTPTQIQTIAAILLAVDDQNADGWLARLRQDIPTPPTHNPSVSTLLLLGQMRGLPGAAGPIPLSFEQMIASGDIKLLEMFKTVSDLLDTAPIFIDNPDVVYEKKKDLTAAYHYVMPMSMLRRHLVDGAQAGHIGRVILASLLLLDTQDQTTIDPDMMAQMLKSLVAVGLSEEARQIATYIFLGVTYIGEEKHGTSRPSGTTETKPASIN